jgi:biopolymer transport protein ExbD
MAELLSSPGKTGGRTTSRLPIRVDLTAMVDLAFLLITFFILTTTLQKNRATQLVMPDKSGPVVDGWAESRTMTICLGNNNKAVWYLGMVTKPIIAPQVTLFGKDMDKAIIAMAKHVLATTGHNMVVIVKPSAQSIYDNLVNTIDQLNLTQTQSFAVTDITAQDIDLLKQKKIYN